MEVILLERVAKLGQMGDTVTVRDGFARNFLLPQAKALRANAANRKRFTEQRAQLETRNLEQKKEATDIGARLADKSFVAIQAAGEAGQLYGSVSSKDIAAIVSEGGFSVAREQIVLPRPIKNIGLHDVSVVLHPEISVRIFVNVARSEDEAKRQARGEDPVLVDDDIGAEDFASAADEAEEELEHGDESGEEQGETEETADTDK